jgi:arginine decarboxylase
VVDFHQKFFFEYDYQYMIDEIINQIKIACDEAEVDVPHIFTEFGSFTVGESGGAIYQILYQKQQNDREKWNMIDSSLLLLYLILGQSISVLLC